MKFADKGTVVRTVLLLLALLNQTLLMFGKSPLNIQDEPGQPACRYAVCRRVGRFYNHNDCRRLV